MANKNRWIQCQFLLQQKTKQSASLLTFAGDLELGHQQRSQQPWMESSHFQKRLGDLREARTPWVRFMPRISGFPSTKYPLFPFLLLIWWVWVYKTNNKEREVENTLVFQIFQMILGFSNVYQKHAFHFLNKILRTTRHTKLPSNCLASLQLQD